MFQYIKIVFFTLICLYMNVSYTFSALTDTRERLPVTADVVFRYQNSNKNDFLKLFNNNDINDVTNNNLLLGLWDTEECAKELETPAFLGAHSTTGFDYLHIATLPYSLIPGVTDQWKQKKRLDNCNMAIWVPKGVTLSSKNVRIAPSVELKTLHGWIKQQLPVNVPLTNNYGNSIKLIWIDESSLETLISEMGPFETKTQGTYLGHMFLARDKDTNEIIDWIVVDGSPAQELNPDNMVQICASEDYTHAVDCDKEKLMWNWVYDFWYQKRQALNIIQPGITPPITKEGFKKVKLPKEAYDRIITFYDKYKSKATEESLAGPCLNQHQSPTYVTHLTPYEKGKLSDFVRPMLAEWSGYPEDELELTSCYGIRKYTNGSVLRMHVDTLTTHVVSAIINVDQNVRKPWNLEILDHDGNVNIVPMEAGDMVYYESARLLHGRPDPLDGESYSNVFIHYKPIHDWDFGWF